MEREVKKVTGAGRGLGKGLALKFAEEGCKVAVTDINKESAEQTTADIIRAGGQAKVFVANIAQVEDVRELHKCVTREFGDVDILVNNAGLIHTEALENYTDDVIKTIIGVNLTSHFWMLREFLPSMKKRNSGHIVAVASVASFAGIANASAYVASKFGVNAAAEACGAVKLCDAAQHLRLAHAQIKFGQTKFDLRMPEPQSSAAPQASTASRKTHLKQTTEKN